MGTEEKGSKLIMFWLSKDTIINRNIKKTVGMIVLSMPFKEIISHNKVDNRIIIVSELALMTNLLTKEVEYVTLSNNGYTVGEMIEATYRI